MEEEDTRLSLCVTFPLVPSSPQLPCEPLSAGRQGTIAANGVPLSKLPLRAGFVQQDDLFYPQVGRRAGGLASGG